MKTTLRLLQDQKREHEAKIKEIDGLISTESTRYLKEAGIYQGATFVKQGIVITDVIGNLIKFKQDDFIEIVSLKKFCAIVDILNPLYEVQ